MSLRGKLFLAQLPLLAALVTVAGVSTHQGSQLAAESERVLRDNFRSVLAAQRMGEAQEQIDAALMAHALGDETAPRRVVGDAMPRLEEQLRIEESNITEPDEDEAAEVLRRRFLAYRDAVQSFLSDAKGPEAARSQHPALAEAQVRLSDAIDRILEINQDAIVRKNDEVARRAARSQSLIGLVAALAILFGLLASRRLIRRLLEPLDALGDAARRIADQDFDARAGIDGEDEIARLAAEFDAMAEQLQRFQRSTLGDLLRTQLAAQSAIDSLPDPVLVFDLDGRLESFNEAANALVGGRLDPTALDALSPADPGVRVLVSRVRAHVLGGHGPYVPRGFDEAVRIPTPEGERWLLARGTPVYDPDQNVTGATLVLQDVTRLRRFDELKSDLVSTVAHEFRTPLTSLRMAIHLCLEEVVGPLTEKQIDLLHAARVDCERLQGMVDDLLDLARIEGGRIQIVPRPMSPGTLLTAAVDARRGAAEARHVSLHGEDANGLPPVQGDAERLPLVFHNLIENALAHTPEGGTVTVRARRAGTRIRFEVEDAGPGIAPEHRGAIFDKFFRAPDAPSGGAGLGLYIAREIVRSHGGEIGADVGAGGGALLWFTLPIARPAGGDGPPGEPRLSSAAP